MTPLQAARGEEAQRSDEGGRKHPLAALGRRVLDEAVREGRLERSAEGRAGRSLRRLCASAQKLGGLVAGILGYVESEGVLGWCPSEKVLGWCPCACACSGGGASSSLCAVMFQLGHISTPSIPLRA